jgi:hypothetical protein
MRTFIDIYSKYALIALAIMAASRLPAQVGLGLAPMREELRFASGAQRSGGLTLSNDSPFPVRVRAEALDFFIDASETPQFGREWPAETPYSCRSWLSLNPMEFALSPGERKSVRYTIRVPQDTTERSYHCAAGFTTIAGASASEGAGLHVAVRVVAAFYAIVGDPSIEGILRQIKLEKVSGGSQPSWRAVVVIENRSDMHFRASGELDLLDADGKVIESGPFHALPVLPKREQRFLFPLQASLTQAKYSLRARLDIGTNEIQEATAVVEVREPTP